MINVEIVGPKVGGELRRQAIYVTLYALAGMLIYIAFRFEWVYGAAAVLAVFHDVLITLGLFSLLHFEISLTVIAALLTLVGYSMNDTIVIFDRIRENVRLMRREPFAAIVNRSINQTLVEDHPNQWPDVPNRPGTFHHGRGCAPQFFICLSGWNSGRNVLKFRYRRSLGCCLGQLERAGRGSGFRIRSRYKSSDGGSDTTFGPGRQEVIGMFDDLVESSVVKKNDQQGLDGDHFDDRSGRSSLLS